MSSKRHGPNPHPARYPWPTKPAGLDPRNADELAPKRTRERDVASFEAMPRPLKPPRQRKAAP